MCTIDSASRSIQNDRFPIPERLSHRFSKMSLLMQDYSLHVDRNKREPDMKKGVGRDDLKRNQGDEKACAKPPCSVCIIFSDEAEVEDVLRSSMQVLEKAFVDRTIMR